MKEIIKMGIILFIVCFVAALLLAFTNEMTSDRIAEQRFLANERAKSDVFPDADYFVDVEEAIKDLIVSEFSPVNEVSIGMNQNGEAIGYVFKSSPGAYGGPMEVITGISIAGEITGVRIGNHQETPGLGAKARDHEFYNQYTGKSALSRLVLTDVDAIAGATITSDAATFGVNASIDTYHWMIEQGGGY